MQIVSLPNYNIFVGNDSLPVINTIISEKSYSSIFVIVDENTKKHCLPMFSAVITVPFFTIEIPAGETNKTLDTCQKIWQSLFDKEANRKSLVINLGGGVIGDMGGFAASTYKRGIDFVQIPTTLLSQVDASIGGKLGIDYYDVKNSIGVFNDPVAVIINPDFYHTLPFGELRSGYAEVIKHALIWNEQEWIKLQQIDDLAVVDWNDYLVTSLSVKKDVVTADPFEKGLRKILNFGHTIGHAIESDLLFSDKRLLHGEAIAIGMICEAYISKKRSLISKEALERICDYLLSIYGHSPISMDTIDKLLQYMRQDKKNEQKEINFSLLNKEGECLFNESADEIAIIESIQFYNSL